MRTVYKDKKALVPPKWYFHLLDWFKEKFGYVVALKVTFGEKETGYIKVNAASLRKRLGITKSDFNRVAKDPDELTGLVQKPHDQIELKSYVESKEKYKGLNNADLIKVAISEDDTRLLALLKKAEVDIDRPDNEGNTPLMQLANKAIDKEIKAPIQGLEVYLINCGIRKWVFW